MAAHILPILERFKTMEKKHVIHALDYAPGCDLLSVEDWEKLKTQVELDNDLTLLLDSLIEAYTSEWESLGKPNSYETWMEAKYKGK